MFNSKKKPDNKKPALKPTQSFLKILEIKDDVMVMESGTLRAVIAVASTNFDLMNPEEQNAFIFNYQRFLNSLEFPVQILIQSRKVDISQYIEKLTRITEKQSNELLRLQSTEYIEFIKRLIETVNIMNKGFYCIVPLEQSVLPKAPGFFAKLFTNTKTKQVTERITNFVKYKRTLDERVNSIHSSLGSMGLKVLRLNSQEIIELLYNSYNFESGPRLDASSLKDVTMVEQ